MHAPVVLTNQDLAMNTSAGLHIAMTKFAKTVLSYLHIQFYDFEDTVTPCMNLEYH